MKPIARVGLIVLGVVLVLAVAGIARFMSLGLPRQDWTPGALDLSTAPDGVYEGQYRIVPPFGTFAAFRVVRVRVELTDHRIRRITVLSPTELADSLADLEDRVLSRQGLDVDAVSGGTWSNRAYLKAVEAAIRGATP